MNSASTFGEGNNELMSVTQQVSTERIRLIFNNPLDRRMLC